MSIKLPVINVKKFGAVGDGVTDDTVAFNSAISAGKNVYIPSGVYRINPASGILVKNGLTLFGDGKDSSVLLAISGVSGSVIKRATPLASGQYIQDVLIKDIGIVLFHPATAASGNYEQIGINLLHVTRSTIENCYVGNYNRGAASGFHVDPSSQANARQGYGIMLGTFSSSDPLYSGGEVNRVHNCTIWGTKKCIVLDDAVYAPNSAAHGTVVSNCDTQIAEAGIVQESQYSTGCDFYGNVVQAIDNAGGSTGTTYAIRIEGYNNKYYGGYIEVASGCDFAVRLGPQSSGNLVVPHRISDASVNFSDAGLGNEIIVSDGTDWRHYGKNKFLKGLKVEGAGADVGLWTTSNWPKTVQVGASGADATLLFPFAGVSQFGFAASAGTLQLIRSGSDSSTGTAYPYWTWTDAGRFGIGGTTSPSALLHIAAGTASSQSAPLKFTAGTNLTNPEAGSVEYNGRVFELTDTNSIRQSIQTAINVKQFGAIGDGSTDDTVAIQSAVTYAISSAGYNSTVVFPHGIYKVSGTITIPQGVMLVCPGSQGANEAYGTVFVHYSTGNLFLWNGASGTAAGTGGGLKNCTIYKASGYSGGDAIKLLAIDDDHRPGEMVFENILTSVLGTGMWQRGFHVDGTACTGVGSKGVRSVWFNKVRFTGCSENNQYVFLNQAVHVNGGLQIDQGGGSGTAGMTISGDSENINLNCILNGALNIYDNATHFNIWGRVSTINIQGTACIGSIIATTTANVTNNSSAVNILSSSSVSNGTRLLVGATGTSINDTEAKAKIYGPIGKPLIDLRATNSGGRTGLTFADGVYGFFDYDPDSSQGVRISSLNNGPLQLGQNSNAFYGAGTFVSGVTVTSGGMTAKSISVNEGSNMTMGSVTLTAGAATVSTTKVTANSRIYLTSQVDGGTPGFLRVSARTAATSFTITSSSGTDTSTVAWLIIEPS